MVFEWSSKVYIYVTWNTNLLRVFLNKKSYPLKSKIVLSSKTFLGQNTCNLIRNYLSTSLYNLSLSREISSSLLHTSEKGLRDRESLVVKHLNAKEGLSLCVSEGVKDLWDSGTPKRVSWGLDIGNGLCQPV